MTIKRNPVLNKDETISFNIEFTEIVYLLSKYKGGKLLQYSIDQYHDFSCGSLYRIKCKQNSDTHKIIVCSLAKFFDEGINIETIKKQAKKLLYTEKI